MVSCTCAKTAISPIVTCASCQTLHARMNLEMAVTEEMLAIACEINRTLLLVPEKRQEVTTEVGWTWPGSAIRCAMPVSARRMPVFWSPVYRRG